MVIHSYNYCYPHFTDEETGAQDEVICPKVRDVDR